MRRIEIRRTCCVPHTAPLRLSPPYLRPHLQPHCDLVSPRLNEATEAGGCADHVTSHFRVRIRRSEFQEPTPLEDVPSQRNEGGSLDQGHPVRCRSKIGQDPNREKNPRVRVRSSGDVWGDPRTLLLVDNLNGWSRSGDQTRARDRPRSRPRHPLGRAIACAWRARTKR